MLKSAYVHQFFSLCCKCFCKRLRVKSRLSINSATKNRFFLLFFACHVYASRFLEVFSLPSRLTSFKSSLRFIYFYYCLALLLVIFVFLLCSFVYVHIFVFYRVTLPTTITSQSSHCSEFTYSLRFLELY